MITRTIGIANWAIEVVLHSWKKQDADAIAEFNLATSNGGGQVLGSLHLWRVDPAVLASIVAQGVSFPDSDTPLRLVPDVREFLQGAGPSAHCSVPSPYQLRVHDLASNALYSFWACPDDAIPALKVDLIALSLQLLAPRTAIVVHSAAVSCEQLTIMVCGPSGAGKSTTARLLGGRLLSDDFVAVTDVADRPTAWAAPFGGRSEFPGPAPVAALVFPKKGRRFSVRRLSRMQALSQFLLEHIGYMGPALLPFSQEVTRLAARLVLSLPVFEVEFSLENMHAATVWDTVGESLREQQQVVPASQDESTRMRPSQG